MLKPVVFMSLIFFNSLWVLFRSVQFGGYYVGICVCVMYVFWNCLKYLEILVMYEWRGPRGPNSPEFARNRTEHCTTHNYTWVYKCVCWCVFVFDTVKVKWKISLTVRSKCHKMCCLALIRFRNFSFFYSKKYFIRSFDLLLPNKKFRISHSAERKVSMRAQASTSESKSNT